MPDFQSGDMVGSNPPTDTIYCGNGVLEAWYIPNVQAAVRFCFTAPILLFMGLSRRLWFGEN
jgi:hypothetical protein